MQKKLLFISFGASIALLFTLAFHVIKDSGREDKIRIEIACEKIEDYTRNYFSFTEDVKIDAIDGMIAVSVSFIPEVGSYPVKEEIYQNTAYHALQIVDFFPEVTHFEYTILWDDYTKQEVLTLVIDEESVKNLAETFFNEYINQNNGIDTSYKDVFSSIIETEVSRSWRNQINMYTDVP